MQKQLIWMLIWGIWKGIHYGQLIYCQGGIDRQEQTTACSRLQAYFTIQSTKSEHKLSVYVLMFFHSFEMSLPWVFISLIKFMPSGRTAFSSAEPEL
jgi:hypothetical protein